MSLFANKMIPMILPALLRSISPVLIVKMELVVNELKVAAETTDNPWDDILVSIMADFVRGISQK